MPANPRCKPEALIDQWRQTADLACEEADRLDKTILAITGASDRCRLAAEIRRRCADELTAALHSQSITATALVDQLNDLDRIANSGDADGQYARGMRCATDHLQDWLASLRCDAVTPANQVSDGGRCVLPVGHVGDHVLRAPTSS